MPPTSKKLESHILLGRLFVCPCICPLRFLVHSITSEPCMLGFLKFHIWIPHEKIADTSFFSYQDYAPFLSYGPLKNMD